MTQTTYKMVLLCRNCEQYKETHTIDKGTTCSDYVKTIKCDVCGVQNDFYALPN